MRTELPFEINPQIKRFLDELTFPGEFDTGEGKNIVRLFDTGERLSEDAFANIENFLKYLQTGKLAKLDEAPKIVKTDTGRGVRPKDLKITVLNEEGLQDLADYITQTESAGHKTSKVRWNAMTRTLSYRDIKPYTFQAKSSARLELFKLLWSKKKHIVSGDTKTIGKPMDPRNLAALVGLTQDRRTHEYNDGGIQTLGDMAKDLGTALKRFPLKISTKGGVQLILTE